MRGGPVTYHDSCSGLRELGVKQQPRQLLRAMGVEIVEMAEPEICCGFGGTFCVKYPEISVRMASDKVRDSLATGAPNSRGGRPWLFAQSGRPHHAGGARHQGATRSRNSRRDDRRSGADRTGSS